MGLSALTPEEPLDCDHTAWKYERLHACIQEQGAYQYNARLIQIYGRELSFGRFEI